MENITFLNPYLLFGLIGITLPIIIHLVGKYRSTKIKFSAFEFLITLNKRLAYREKIRQWLVLLLRILVIMALISAISRPIHKNSLVATSDQKNIFVMIVDTSLSMQYHLNGKTLLEHAKDMALESLSKLQTNDGVILVIAGDTIYTPLQKITTDHTLVRDAIKNIDITKGKVDIQKAIDQGLSQITDNQNKATIMIFSDLSKNSFSHIKPIHLKLKTQFRLFDVASRKKLKPLRNIAIKDIFIEEGQDTNERRFNITLHNYGASSLENIKLELLLDDKVVLRGYSDIPAQSSTIKIMTYHFNKPGFYNGKVHLLKSNNDGYSIDDIAYFQTQISPLIRVLAINGDPRTIPYEDELYFIEHALQNIPQNDSKIDLQIITIDEFNKIIPSDFNVIILAHVSNINLLQQNILVEFVKNGGGLFITLGDAIHFERFNKNMSKLLPNRLRDLHRVSNPDSNFPPLSIENMDWDHPILKNFGTSLETSLKSSKTTSYFNIETGKSHKKRSILYFENGAPALIELLKGKGRIILFTSSIDLDLTDLPLQSAFPPLIQQTIRYLAKSIKIKKNKNLRVGDNTEILAPTGAKTMMMIDPKDKEYILPIVLNKAYIKNLMYSGLYKIKTEFNTGFQNTPKLNFVVSPILSESNFTPITEKKISVWNNTSNDNDLDISVILNHEKQDNPFNPRGFSTSILLVLCLFFIGENLFSSKG